jgi:hypothetical protein
MPDLVEAWDAAVAGLADDWSHLTVSLTLADPEMMEQAALLVCSVNPWHGSSWRTGVLQFRVARTTGYGASSQLVRGVLGRVDDAEISGSIHIHTAMDGVAPVATQGPTF